MLHIPGILNAEQVAGCRARLLTAAWADGRITAGYQSARAKNNLQLPAEDTTARELSLLVREALQRHPLFFSAALPRHIFTPLFSCYRSGDGFGNHIDNAVRYDRGVQRAGETAPPVRTDLSATLFLSAPEEYEGGELVIEDPLGARRVKLAAGDLALYSATSVHRVEPIGHGVRLACFFWIQSLVRDAEKRKILLDLDGAIQRLEADHEGHPSLINLVGVYHNLLRQWSDT
jgi:PKHD-type hydroxylase